MKKKRLFTLLMAGMLAASSPTAVFAAEFSDSEFSDSGVAEEDAGYEKTAVPDAEALISDEQTAGDEDLFQSASPEEEMEIFSSEQEALGDEAGDADISDGEIRKYVTIDNVRYQYMEDKDSYIVRGIYNPMGEKIVVRAEIDGKKVTEIASSVYEESWDDSEYYESTGDLILPDGLLVIQSHAFEQSSFLSLHIPDSVTEIGSDAFISSSVRFIHFPASMTVIPEGLIDACSNLETIEIPEGVVELASGAFNRCAGLKKLYLPKSMTKIGEDLFAKKATVTIIAPKGSYAEEYAREHGLNFSAGEEPGPEPGQENVTLDGVCYTYQKSSDSYLVTNYTFDITEEVTIPETILGKPVTGIGNRAFYDCYRINRICLPSTIKSIGDESFALCVNLHEINLPDGLKSIGHSVFERCNLGQVIFPDSVTTMGYGIFYRANILEQVRLPENITSLPPSTFAEATLLTPLVLPSGIKSIGTYAFANFSCREIILPDKLTSIDDSAFFNSGVESITIPDSVTKMGRDVFAVCYLRTVKWGKGLKSVPEGTFRDNYSLEELSLPNTVTAIEKEAFQASTLRRLFIPKTVKKIDKTAFTSCDHLTLYVMKGSYAETFAKNNKIPYTNGTIASSIVKQDGIRYEYRTASKNYAVIDADETLSGNIVIPKTIKGKKVEAIDYMAFEGCNSILSIEMPDTIQFIGDDAFKGCSSLKEIHISESVYAIGGNYLPKACVIYGKSGSVAENFANSNGYTFVSDGEAVLSAPVLSMERFDGNCIHITMSKRGYNAQSYEYVLSKDKNFPKSGKYMVRQKLAGAEEQKLDFKLLDKGSYYTFARSIRTLKDGKTEYSSWSKPVLTVVSTQAPKSPTVKSVTVKGNTVTVLLNKTAGAKGYTGVLANGTKKEGAQKLLMPDNVRYSADSSTTKLVFKNVKKGTYQLLVKGYAKQKNGAKVCSKWRARTAKVKVK